MLWIALAASQMSMPLPINALGVFSPDDMPTYVQTDGINRFIPARITIRPDGTAQDCGWERSSGDAKLDALTCGIILKRAKFGPTTWVDGSPAYAVLRTSVTWSIRYPASEQELRKAYPPDLELFLNQLPEGARSPTTLFVIVAVDENGRVAGCDALPPLPAARRKKRFPGLVPLACGQMAKQYVAIPAKDAAGHAVRSVQTASVAFSRGP
jgi:hypothetical protein